MSAADAAWLHLEDPANLMVITGLMWFGGRLDAECVLRRLEQRLVSRYLRFRHRVVEPTRARSSSVAQPH